MVKTPKEKADDIIGKIERARTGEAMWEQALSHTVLTRIAAAEALDPLSLIEALEDSARKADPLRRQAYEKAIREITERLPPPSV